MRGPCLWLLAKDSQHVLESIEVCMWPRWRFALECMTERLNEKVFGVHGLMVKTSQLGMHEVGHEGGTFIMHEVGLKG